ncbi:MAG TPA: WhiB family transcriptional regulator [Mycobacteriales bacterium]|jgi:WhiB family redox-sensing transcriptional regulator|nr:WhiB family transcriptional regulator [Mycobacteriales bacterium]
MYQDTTWRVDALCRGDDAVHFFAPNHMERKEEKDAREARARALCARCPVQDLCLDYALGAGEPHGIWGGLNELQRRRLLRRRTA